MVLLTLELPDSIAGALTDHRDRDLAHLALEGLAIEGYREERLTQKQVGELLGFSRIQTEEFLAQHVDLYDYDPAELAREADSLKAFAARAR
jgi:predicted HTH domain antitoxin